MTIDSNQDHTHKLGLLVELSRQLNGSKDLEPFLQSIVDAACELTDSQASSISLLEQETGLLKFVAAPRSQIEKLKRFRIPLEKSLAGKAFRESRPVVVHDASQDPNLYRAVDLELPFVTKSVVAVPVVCRDESLGVLEVVNKHDDTHYTEEDVTILETLASYAATAIFNTLLFEEARLAYQDLEQLDRKKSDFIAIASHELRTPLGLILGHAGFLREAVPLSQYQQQLDIILQNALRLKTLLEDMSNSNLGEQQSMRIKRHRIVVNEVVNQVGRTFREEALNKNIYFKINLPVEELTIYGDPEKIALALGNLVKNALTYTDTGGHVIVQAEKLPGYVKISVTDNGVGIPAKDIPHIFERFFQVESHYTRRHGGMGLGLAVAKVMVELHGGQIWVESLEGRGSTFSFLLPAGDLPVAVKPAVTGPVA